jgi:cellulose synthase (UDP-forming)
MLVILFWVLRNMYSIILVLFLINGRDDDSDTDSVIVKAGEMISLKNDNKAYECISTRMTEHSLKILMDEADAVRLGDKIEAAITSDEYSVTVSGVVIDITELRHSAHALISVEILDFGSDENKFEYYEILYDRIPTLPQSLERDFGSFRLFWRNIVYRIMRTV